MQKYECDGDTCTNNLKELIFDRENDLPDPDQPQQITKNPIRDGKGIEIVDKCIQEPIKDLMKYSNNDYAMLYICQNVLRIRKFNSSGEEIKFVEITIENIYLFDATILNDLIYMIIVYDSDKKISKVYKLDEITNQLIPQLDQSCELDTQDIKIESFKLNYLIFITCLKNYVFDGVSQIGQSQSLFVYDPSNLKVFEKIDVNNPDIFTIDDCNKNIIKGFKVLGNMIYLINVNLFYAKIMILDDYGGLVQTYNVDVPNITQIKLDKSNDLIALMYKISGKENWVFKTCIDISICFNSYQQKVSRFQDFSFAIFSNKVVISYCDKLNQKLVYKILNDVGETIFSETIQIDSQISRPLLVTFSNQQIGFAWEYKNNEAKWGLQLSILSNTGDLNKVIINTCSPNCASCLSNTECTKCEASYQLQYNKLKNDMYCEQQVDQSCFISIGNYCIQCSDNRYPYEQKCVVDEFQSKSLVLNEFTQFVQTKPSIAGFSDGSIMAVWISNYQDGFNWGVYGQVLDSQREKIGNNFQVNQITQGNQHSAQISILNDDTAIILYIDGNLEQGALLKIARFTKNQQRIGDDIDIDVIKLDKFNINTQNNIAKVIKLKNGGYVIGYITLSGEPQHKVLKLKFYNSDNQQVNSQEVQGEFDDDQLFQISSADLNVAVIFRRQVNVFTFEGSFIVSQGLSPQFNNPLCLSSTSQYFIIVFSIYENSNVLIYAQFYDQNFIPLLENKKLIKQFAQQLDHNYQQISYIQVDQYKGGLSIIIEIVKDIVSATQEQYFLNQNMEVQFMNKYIIKDSWQDLNFMKIIESVDQSFFVIWVNYNLINKIDSSNIHIQKMSAQGEYLTKIVNYCFNNCRQCGSNNMCTQCPENYQLHDGACLAICQESCVICIIPSVCYLCRDGYYEETLGVCAPLKPNYHKPQIIQEIEGDINELVGLNDGNICFFTLYHPQGQSIYYWNFYIISQQIQTMKVTIERSIIFQSLISFQQIEQDYLGISYAQEFIEVIRIGQNQQVILNKVIDLSKISLDVFLSKDCVILEAQVNNQYSLTYCHVTWDQIITTRIFRLILDSELNPLGFAQQILEQNDVGPALKENNKFRFYSQGETALFIGNQLIWKSCPFSQVLQQQSCDVFELSNGNLIQFFTSADFQYDFDFKGGYSIYYRLLNNQYIPLTQEMKVSESSLMRQQFIKIVTFQNSFAIVIKQYNTYNDMMVQLVIQYFENSGSKLNSQIFIDLLNAQMFNKIISFENSLKVYWQKWICLEVQCSNMILFKEYDEYGNEITNGQNIKCMQYCDECINESYCTKCSTNYNLDANSQCILQCPSNCNKCSVVAKCEICQTGYELINDQCIKFKCPNNCDKCYKESNNLVCYQCQDNYYLNQLECLPQCPSSCRTCDLPFNCTSCPEGFVLTADAKCKFEDQTVVDQVKNTSVSTPIRYTFPDGSYVLVWYQNGEKAGVYFQLYSANNSKLGAEIIVSDYTRRLLVDSSIKKQYYAHLAAVDYNFYVVWADSTSDQTNFLLQEFDSTGTKLTSAQSIGVSNNNVVSSLTQPCQLLTLSNKNMVVSFMTQSPEDQSNYNFKYQLIDPNLQGINSIQEIPNVSYLVAPSITEDDQGMIYISYTSNGYMFVQQITQFGNPVNQPQAISDDGTFALRTAYLKNGMFVFLWESKNIQTYKALFSLNYQLISKDLSQKSEVKVIGSSQIKEQTPDLKLFKDGFIVAWQTTDSQYQPNGIQFQIFDSLGVQLTQIIKVAISGKYPQNPNIQIMNDDKFAITYISKSLDVDGSILGDSIQIQYYNKQGQEQFITTPQLCGKECNICQSPLNCYRCSYGYYLSLDNQCIMDCGLYCNQCEVPLVCQSCVNGYELNSSSSCTEVSCPLGYQRNSKTKLCDPECPNECVCSLPNVCSSCIAGYYLKDSQCHLTSNPLSESPISNPYIFYALIVVCLILLINWICCYKCYIHHRKKQKVHLSDENIGQLSSAGERQQTDNKIQQETVSADPMIKKEKINEHISQIQVKSDQDNDNQQPVDYGQQNNKIFNKQNNKYLSIISLDEK
ncbi:unnamed protein product (macronuclear) [Paramecium tetraurelia]|uniref:EGF-like domain-containing protein n=1 Tax=Paramecium tetraurelia TaxID=5888 RepID=A0CJ61_PARTE|nr:uncharacterized protein GSPATT00038610001 [Paramecium tetraurelia]CAK70828.1 unnamed protein product [Paramecium tetraurelia]|eukprot:XP_001438225.1 hypothetical protein (macronuclear) [Paramecium tetraurelia strain d4-2]